MPKFSQIKRLLSLFLIRAVLMAGFFSFPFGLAEASGQELYSQPFLRKISAFAKASDYGKASSDESADAPLYNNQKWVKIPIIAIVDEGVDFSHPDLNGLNFGGWNFILNSGDIAPLGGHGTTQAGIIKAIAKNSGVEIKIMPLIACSQNFCDIAAISQSIRFAADNGADVINLSFGTKPGSYESAFDEAIAYAHSKNAVIVAAAGQDGAGLGIGINLDISPISPVCNDNGRNMILGAGAADSYGNAANWANFGSCVDVLAPAENIYTTFSPQFSNGQNYGYVSGTSYAAPQTSALAALIKAQNPKLGSKKIVDKIKLAARQNGGLIDIQKTLTNQEKQILPVQSAKIPKHKVLGVQTRFSEKALGQPAAKDVKKIIKPRG